MRTLFAMALAGVLTSCLIGGRAEAIPSFAQQTGQPCSACHVGAFGPQLKPYGRDFKLYGYTSTDGQKHLAPIAFTLQSGFTHTAGAQPDLLQQGFKTNNNFSVGQEISAYYGGRLAKEVGAFIQVSYDDSSKSLHWDNTDVRYAHPLQVFGKDSVFGLTLNNSPTMADLWNSTPSWGFPYNGTSIAPLPTAATLVDRSLSGQILGAGAYASWNDLLYVEGTVYRFLSRSALDRLGVGPGPGQAIDTYGGAIPYGRLALEHATDHHYFQVGTFALAAGRYPGGDEDVANKDRIVDRAVDANYQYLGSKTHFWSFHAVHIHESQDLRADQILAGTHATDVLRTSRADVSYSFRDTWTPSLQYFSTTGSGDVLLWGTPNGSPNSRGFIAEIAYTPLGKFKSVPQWMNVRLAAQYVGYRQFDGTSQGSARNDTLYLSIWIAVAPLYALEKHVTPAPAVR